MKPRFRVLVLVLGLVAGLSLAQSPPPAWHDELAEDMAGDWNVEGQVLGRPAHHEIQAEWVLNHQFLRIHEKTSAAAPGSENRYEALWFLGYDPVSERYVVHLLDVFGTRFSETLGYGTRDGNSLRFVFEYPDGPFHTTYRWSPQSKTWQWFMETKNKDGKWISFADLKLARAATHR
jgi:hypothetical protein